MVYLLLAVAGFDVDDAEFVAQEFFVVVGVEYFDPDQQCCELLRQEGVEEMDQQVAVLVAVQQCLEDAVNFGVDGVLHGETIA